MMPQPSIPQDIIDNIIRNIGTHEKSLLRTYTLVSHSFLYPSRKRLFAHISLHSTQYCRGFLNLLVGHPYLQSYVKTLNISYHSLLRDNPAFENDLLPLLHLLLCSLEELRFGALIMPVDWHDLSTNLRDTLSDMIHSPSLTFLTLNALTNVPNELFIGLKGVQTLSLEQVHLIDIAGGEEHGVSRSADSNEVRKIWTSPDHDIVGGPIEYFAWQFEAIDWGPAEQKSIVMNLPFLAHPRFVRFDACKLDLINLFLNALGSSLHSPATLEHLQLSCANGYDWFRDTTEFLADLDINIWTELDNLATDPLYANLHRVDIIIELHSGDEDLQESKFREKFLTILPQNLPLLSSKGILHITLL